jgi:hypothetical protein
MSFSHLTSTMASADQQQDQPAEVVSKVLRRAQVSKVNQPDRNGLESIC